VKARDPPLTREPPEAVAVAGAADEPAPLDPEAVGVPADCGVPGGEVPVEAVPVGGEVPVVAPPAVVVVGVADGATTTKKPDTPLPVTCPAAVSPTKV
jgi:hypothetical protein